VSYRLINFEEALIFFKRLPDSFKVPTLSPCFLLADSFRGSFYNPTFWLYERHEDFALRAFHIVETKLSSKLTVKDIESAYGYGGVVSSTTDECFLSDAFKEYKRWAVGEGVLLEFFRIHPLLGSQRNSFEQISFNRSVVCINLQKDFFSNYSSRKRTYLRKEKNKDTKLFASKTNISDFIELYRKTMLRLGADQKYYFSRMYFEKMLMCENANIWFLTYSGVLSAAVLIFAHPSSGIVEYHLGGYLQNGQDRPIELLLHLVAERYAESGYSKFYIGGGRSEQPDDSLLRFKKSFSKETLDFNIGFSIFDSAKYELIKKYHSNSKLGNRVIFYRN